MRDKCQPVPTEGTRHDTRIAIEIWAIRSDLRTRLYMVVSDRSGKIRVALFTQSGYQVHFFCLPILSCVPCGDDTG